MKRFLDSRVGAIAMISALASPIPSCKPAEETDEVEAVTPAAAEPLMETPQMRETLGALQRKFRTVAVAMQRSAGSGSITMPLLRPGVVRQFDLLAGDRMVPHLPSTDQPNSAPPIRVELPRMASGLVRLQDATTHMAVSFGVLGAESVPVEVADGIAAYPASGAYGETMLDRIAPEGVERFSVFEQRPSREAIRYSMELTGVAGLRLVANVLEFLDARGIPRMRVGPVHLSSSADRSPDGSPRGHTAALRLDGCDADTSARPPWERPTTPPCALDENGSTLASGCRCELQVEWNHLEVDYPAIVYDPWWSTTAMVEPRCGATASVLPDKTVLVAGGTGNSGLLNSVELFYLPAPEDDPTQQGIWAIASFLAEGRVGHTASTLHDGGVLIAGGDDGEKFLRTAVRFDFSTYNWISVGPMLHPRFGHAAVTLKSGEVLVTGGGGSTRETEVFDPISDTWQWKGTHLSDGWHTANLMADGRVIVIYQPSITPIPVNPSDDHGAEIRYPEIFDPAALDPNNLWTLGPWLNIPMLGHTTDVLWDGRILVVGGASSLILEADSWSLIPSPIARSGYSSNVLPNGFVVFAGGYGTYGKSSNTIQMYDPYGPGAWLDGEPLLMPRHNHVTAVMGDVVLVAGGQNDSEGILASSELWRSFPCATDKDCNPWTTCDGTICVRVPPFCQDPHTLLDGQMTRDCGFYSCVQDRCQSSCVTNADCSDGSSCGADGSCKPLPNDSYAGWACRLGATGATQPLAVFSGLLAAFAHRFSRRRKSRVSVQHLCS